MSDDRDPETFAIIGAAMEVHRTLGHGFLEAVYQEALSIEFAQRQLPHEQEVKLTLQYKGVTLGTFYRPDFLCYDAVVVELKATSDLTGAHTAQVLNALKATGFKRGLLLNFGQSSLQFKRFVR